MSNKSEFKCGTSPLTGIIYAGRVSSKGFWIGQKHDVTDSAVTSVAEHLLKTEQKLQFQTKGKTYELLVKEVK